MVQCYFKRSDQVIRQNNLGVCLGSESLAGYYSCCYPWDECLPGRLCYDKTNIIYYTSMCTDQTLGDSACQQECGGVYLDRLAYNSTSRSWACCGSGTACSTELNRTFEAPAPEVLRAQTMMIADFVPTRTLSSSLASSVSSSTSSATSSTSSALSAASTNTGRSSGSSLSGGAKAGIGVGVAVAALGLIAAIAFVLYRRKGRHRTTEALAADILRGNGKIEKDGRPITEDGMGRTIRMRAEYYAELPEPEMAAEMEDGHQRQQ